MMVSDGIAYLAADPGGVHILNVTEPNNPVFLATYTANKAWNVFVLGNRLYVPVTFAGEFHIVNVSDPSSPTS